MEGLMWLLVAVFLPVFPLSMIVNLVYDRLRSGIARSVLLVAWPQAGLAIAATPESPPPDWLLPMAVLTAALYAFRALALREVGQWTSFIATSSWALLWMMPNLMQSDPTLHFLAICISAPLVLMTLLGGGLERRFGAAYTGLYGGLARTLPRLAGVLVVVVLAIVATPVFPMFFVMIKLVVQATRDAPYLAMVLLGTWLLWGWAGARLLQGLIVGRTLDIEVADLHVGTTWLYALALLLLAVSGIFAFGGGL